MGREIRRVLPNWEHPKGDNPWGYGYIPQYDKSYLDALKEYNDWRSTFDENDAEYYEDGPNPDRYMYKNKKPSKEELTHYQYYEDVSEGTPQSPVFETPHELATWLSENCGGKSHIPIGTYEQFMDFIDVGWGVSMVMTHTSDGRTFVSEINGISV